MRIINSISVIDILHSIYLIIYEQTFVPLNSLEVKGLGRGVPAGAAGALVVPAAGIYQLFFQRQDTGAFVLMSDKIHELEVGLNNGRRP